MPVHANRTPATKRHEDISQLNTNVFLQQEKKQRWPEEIANVNCSGITSEQKSDLSSEKTFRSITLTRILYLIPRTLLPKTGIKLE
jgi:hypothetical protein